MNFIYKKVSTKQTIDILAQHDIHVNDDEAAVVLDFLYLMSKNYREPQEDEKVRTLTVNRTSEKMR